MSSHKYVLISLFLIYIFQISCSGPKSVQENLKLPVDIPLNPYVSRLVTIDAVANSDTLHLLFDTGGGLTLIGPKIAKRLGCEPSGRSVGFRMTGDHVNYQICSDIVLNIGGIDFRHETIGVWDVNSVLPENLPPLDGILSLKTFSNQPFTLDLSNKRLILESEQSLSERVKNMSRLKSRIATGPDGSELTVFLHGMIKKAGWFLLDSGNLDVVQVSPHLDFNSVGDSIISSNIWESEFMLDGLSPVLTRFRTKDIIYDGALSEKFMREWIFTFDLASNAIWISPIKNH